MERFQKEMANIPGYVEEAPEEPQKIKTVQRFLEEEKATSSNHQSFSSEFFKQERVESEAELLQKVGDSQDSKNFLVRPKSSGARLYGSKSGKSLLFKSFIKKFCDFFYFFQF